jgi:HK97 family phage prohead protease
MESIYAIEFRAEVEGNRVTGHAAVFGQYASVGGHFETIAPGAFKRALDEKQDVRLTVGHDQSKILGRTKSGTLKLSTDSLGLRFDAELPDTQLGRDTVISIRRGDLADMSFAFRPTADSWQTRDGKQINVIEDLDLHDVSFVGSPAYKGTDVRLRAFEYYPASPGISKRLVRAKSRLLLTECK